MMENLLAIGWDRNVSFRDAEQFLDFGEKDEPIFMHPMKNTNTFALLFSFIW